MTLIELILASLLITQSVAWISVDYRRFSKNFDRWADR